MKKNIIFTYVFIFVSLIITAACKPNGNNNSTDVHNSMGEGLDTTHPIDKASPPHSAYQSDTSANADTLATKPAGH